MNLLTDSLKTAAADPVEMSAEVEGAKLGAAADRKRREEATLSLEAAITSAHSSGKGVRWERRIRANGEVRHVAMYERDGAYSERSFLGLCAKAARAAGKGRLRWDGEAVDAIAAELCVSVLAETGGRMPRRGSLGRRQGFEDADAAYLTVSAARLIAQALNGERRRAGLNAEIDAMAAVDGAAEVTSADLLTASRDAAESEPHRYMAEADLPAMDGVSDWDAAEWERAEGTAQQAAQVLTPSARRAVSAVAALVGKRPASVEAALVSALHEREQAADLATAGYGTTAGAHRKAASTGRGILAEVWDFTPTTAEQAAQVEALADALVGLCAIETADHEPKHLAETNGPEPYRGAGPLDWREVTPQSVRDHAGFYVDQHGRRVEIETAQS